MILFVGIGLGGLPLYAQTNQLFAAVSLTYALAAAQDGFADGTSLTNGTPMATNMIVVTNQPFTLPPNAETASTSLPDIAGAGSGGLIFPILAAGGMHMQASAWSSNRFIGGVPNGNTRMVQGGGGVLAVVGYLISADTPYTFSFKATASGSANPVQFGGAASYHFVLQEGTNVLAQVDSLSAGGIISFTTNGIVHAGNGVTIQAECMALSNYGQVVSATTNVIYGDSVLLANFDLTLNLSPTLSLTAKPGSLTLSWPTNFPGFLPQQSTNLFSSAAWVSVNGGGITVSNGMNVLPIPAGTNQQVFYRLKQ